jgi:hypothetical protein
VRMPNYKLPAVCDVFGHKRLQCGMRFLRLRPLAAAGLRQLIASIDSAGLAEHERNRGLRGLERRLAEVIARARACGLPVQASVTVSRLVRYDELREVSSLFRRSAGQSLWALVGETPKMLCLARRRSEPWPGCSCPGLAGRRTQVEKEARYERKESELPYTQWVAGLVFKTG